MQYTNTQSYFYDGFNGAFHTHNEVAKLLGQPTHHRNLPPVKVVQQHSPVIVPSHYYEGHWTLTLEDGRQHHGYFDHYHIHLPAGLPLGYHELAAAETTCRIIIAPAKAYQPQALKQHKKLWGASVQLYTLRSEQNWGIGDFSDLQQFLTHLAENGGDFVGLNPIHALFPANADNASPYSPSSRLWQNIIYIDVNAVEAFQQSEQAQQWFHHAETQATLARLRAADEVDYSAVMALKLQGLRLAYAQFKQQDQHDFEQFMAEKGESLVIQGTFDALHQYLKEQFPEQWGWDFWATEYQDYHNDAVRTFQAKNADLIRFFMWLQFIAEQQLTACYQLTEKLDMPIGFYRDLAVGVANNGAETWADKSLYVLGATIGAPADMLAPQGQNWGLSPMHPGELQQRAYAPFIDLLRANMKHCGALRIDHVLGLARLWWVLNGGVATEGVYIRYPFDDLLNILALESQRHRCLVVAEALGTVPDGMLEALESRGILPYNVFYFEFEGEESKPLLNYTYESMTTLSTHDLPTIKGYWLDHDFRLGEKYAIYPSEEVLRHLKAQRIAHKSAFNRALQAEKYPTCDTAKNFNAEFNAQLQTFVAGTHSALYATQPEDWLNMLDPVNIPGTSGEYPNWRRKLSHTIEEIFQQNTVKTLLASIKQKRDTI
ncbi:4-alpha-glucanotransferase [Pasteurellaceae bacterium Macca]|nr:4-alpha-glucanotransferase [Pasteurellaceae bacterium Macca]